MTPPPECITSCPSIDQKVRTRLGPITGGPVEEINPGQPAKRKCGCTKTSEKLKQILGTFPAPPPPTPMNGFTVRRKPTFCIHVERNCDKYFMTCTKKISK